uniref:Uncharacterized protein n=1 Tax=Anguilla anguilla TaxID=7936 RepID=A0A0E9WYZ5_ANGAN
MSAFHPFLNEPCPDWRGEVQHVRSEDEDWDGRGRGGSASPIRRMERARALQRIPQQEHWNCFQKIVVSHGFQKKYIHIYLFFSVFATMIHCLYQDRKWQLTAAYPIAVLSLVL